MKNLLLFALLFSLCTHLTAAEPKTQKTEVKDPDIMEVLPAKQYVQFSELDTVPEDAIKWDPKHVSKVYISKTQPPYVFLTGKVAEGKQLYLDGIAVPLKDQTFEQKVSLAPEPKTFSLRVGDSPNSGTVYRLIYSWIQIPPSLRFRVKETDTGTVTEKSAGFSGKLKQAAFTQLYSNGEAVQVVDLDSQKRAKLAFRINYPREAEESYDGWSLLILNSQKRPVTELKRNGSPPLYVEWSEVWHDVVEKDTYTYQVNLYKGDSVYEGVENTFEAIAGHTITKHTYDPAIYIEPRQEIGYVTVKSNSSYSFSNVYALTDLPVTFNQTYIIRGTGMIALPSIRPSDTYTFTRLGAGMHLFGKGENSALLGSSYLFRFDVYLNYIAYTTFQSDRFSHMSVLAEPHLVLWKQYYIVPFVEYGVNPKFNSMVLNAGLSYQFYVRPWSVKFGMGVAYDGLIKNDDKPAAKFNAFRFLTSASFIL